MVPTSPHGAHRRAVHALFQQRVSGDEALLRLARLRFAQMGVSAEVYADTPEQLEYVLRFAPAQPRLPMVHLNRGVSLLQERGRGRSGTSPGGSPARITAWSPTIGARWANCPASGWPQCADLDAFLRKEAPEVTLFVEYAAGMEPGRFAELAEGLQDAAHVSFCIDVGHVGIRQAGAGSRAAIPT